MSSNIFRIQRFPAKTRASRRRIIRSICRNNASWRMSLKKSRLLAYNKITTFFTLQWLDRVRKTTDLFRRDLNLQQLFDWNHCLGTLRSWVLMRPLQRLILDAPQTIFRRISSNPISQVSRVPSQAQAQLMWTVSGKPHKMEQSPTSWIEARKRTCLAIWSKRIRVTTEFEWQSRHNTCPTLKLSTQISEKQQRLSTTSDPNWKSDFKLSHLSKR